MISRKPDFRLKFAVATFKSGVYNNEDLNP